MIDLDADEAKLVISLELSGGRSTIASKGRSSAGIGRHRRA